MPKCPGTIVLGFEVDGSLEISVPVHRDELVAMNDLPYIVRLAQTQRVPEPTFDSEPSVRFPVKRIRRSKTRRHPRP